MSLESIMASYRYQPFGKRAFFVGLAITFAIAVYSYNNIIIAQEELTAATGARNSARAKYDKAKSEARNLPRLEKELAETESKLKEAKRKLPDEFIMDKVLQKTAMLAEDIGMVLQVFDPDKGAISKTAFKYMELPIKLELFGTYSEVATFFDRLAHLELLIHLRDITLRREGNNGATNKSKNDTGTKASHVDPMLLPRTNSGNLRIYATANMIIYRGLSPEEAQDATTADTKTGVAKPAKKRKPGPTGEDQKAVPKDDF